jgi:hypothetical protein
MIGADHDGRDLGVAGIRGEACGVAAADALAQLWREGRRLGAAVWPSIVLATSAAFLAARLARMRSAFFSRRSASALTTLAAADSVVTAVLIMFVLSVNWAGVIVVEWPDGSIA